VFRRISAVVIAFAVIVALVWRCTGDEKATAAPHATPPPLDRGEPSPASAGIAQPDRLPAERVETIREESREAPRATAETVPSSTLGTLRGRLGDAVPRPVQDGHVWVKLDRGETEGAEQVDLDFEALVSADGTFELAELPPGHGQIIALCRGWVSRRTPFDAIEAVTRRLGREPTMGEIEQAFQEEGPETLEAQRIVVSARDALVVAMERTGAVEVTVRKQDGAPLAGAVVSASPEVHWIGAEATVFPWRDWKATTGAGGRARIDDLPPDESLVFDARHDSFRMTRADRDRTPSVMIISGMTARRELVLEPAD